MSTLSVFASLRHLSQRERQGVLTVSLFSTEKDTHYSIIHYKIQYYFTVLSRIFFALKKRTGRI